MFDEEHHRWPRRVVKRDYPNYELYFTNVNRWCLHTKLVVIVRLPNSLFGWVVDHGTGPLYQSCRGYVSAQGAVLAYERLFGRLPR